MEFWHKNFKQCQHFRTTKKVCSSNNNKIFTWYNEKQLRKTSSDLSLSVSNDNESRGATTQLEVKTDED